MRNAAVLLAAMLAVCAAGVARTPEVYAKDRESKAKPKAKPKVKAENCVRLVETRDDEDHMTFTLVNRCKQARACTIKWAVTCDGAEPDEQQRESDIPSGGEEAWSVSAAHCGDAGFVISPPKWSCKAAAAPATAAY